MLDIQFYFIASTFHLKYTGVVTFTNQPPPPILTWQQPTNISYLAVVSGTPPPTKGPEVQLVWGFP